MKKLVALFVSAAFAPLAWSADYTVFRVCEDQHVIRTADGAEAGHVEYIVFEPQSRRIVSTIVTGGVIGEKYVALPGSVLRFEREKEIVLTDINRDRLMSAPTIERTQITSSTVIQPAVFERTYTHFGVRADADLSSTSTSTNFRTGSNDSTIDSRTSTQSTTDTSRQQGANANKNN